MSEPLISPNIVRRYMHLFSRSIRSTANTSVRSTTHRSHLRNRQRTLDPPQTPTAEAILARTQLRTVRTSDESHETGGHTRSESAPAYANECTTEQRRTAKVHSSCSRQTNRRANGMYSAPGPGPERTCDTYRTRDWVAGCVRTRQHWRFAQV